MTQEPLIVIPDIHAHCRQLESLVNFLRRKGYFWGHKLLLLGDILDRGPDSKLAMDLVCSLVDEGHVCCKGNHDFTAESAVGLVPLTKEVRLAWVKRWATNYESGTLASYGLKRPLSTAPLEEWVEVADALREAMPERHRQLLCRMPWFWETESLVFVHAGLLLDVPWEKQKLNLASGSRNDPLGPAQLFSFELAANESVVSNSSFPQRVVSGHSYTPQPVITPTRVLLNCGVDLGGPLVAWVTDTNEVFAADAFSAAKVTRLEV